MKDGSTWLEFSSDTRLEGAVINDEVSHRVLSFVAPVLDGATRVQGRVSFELAEAAFPLIGAPAEEATAQGKLLFDDVRFMPGELADQLLSVFRLESKPLVELRDPVSVRIAGSEDLSERTGRAGGQCGVDRARRLGRLRQEPGHGGALRPQSATVASAGSFTACRDGAVRASHPGNPRKAKNRRRRRSRSGGKHLGPACCRARWKRA